MPEAKIPCLAWKAHAWEKAEHGEGTVKHELWVECREDRNGFELLF